MSDITIKTEIKYHVEIHFLSGADISMLHNDDSFF